MKNSLLCFIFTAIVHIVYAQSDSSLSLHIIGEKVVVNKEKLLLNFSYYYENQLANDVAVVDYYSPCFWEDAHQDTSKSSFLVLIIKDDSGKIVLPTQPIDSVYSSDHDKFLVDSTQFYDKFEKMQKLDFVFHTRVLHPKDVLINLFTMKLNKRKCFQARYFDFDFSRKHTISLFYLAKDDILLLLNKTVLKPDDEVFLGKIHSNEVELIFR